MRVLVLTPYLYGTAPGPRSSIELWEQVLRPEGITFEYRAFESFRLHEIIYQPGHILAKTGAMTRAYGHQIRALDDLEAYDAVLVYREAALIGPAIIERLAARKGKPIIYQLDDPLYVPYRSPSNGYLSYLKFFGKVSSLCRMSRVVIVNSPQHREFAQRHNSNVHLIPSVVDGERYQPKSRQGGAGSPVRVGWSGSSSTVKNLRVIEDVLSELTRRTDVTLSFIGASSIGIPGIEASVQPWCAETEIDDLRRLDIGLLPLPVNEWTKRKFYLKLVQYMALGIPAVCTPIGANPGVVQNGITGYLADGTEAWIEAIDRLVVDRDLRMRMGKQAANVAHQRYTLAANAEKIIGAIRSAVT